MLFYAPKKGFQRDEIPLAGGLEGSALQRIPSSPYSSSPFVSITRLYQCAESLTVRCWVA